MDLQLLSLFAQHAITGVVRFDQAARDFCYVKIVPEALADPEGYWSRNRRSFRRKAKPPPLPNSAVRSPERLRQACDAMSGDEKKNFERIRVWSGGSRGLAELDTPSAELERISPIYFLDRIQAAVSIHHGEADELVPLEWSLDLCDRLRALGKPVECFTYPGQPHTFAGERDEVFIGRTVEFLEERLREERDGLRIR